MIRLSIPILTGRSGQWLPALGMSLILLTAFLQFGCAVDTSDTPPGPQPARNSVSPVKKDGNYITASPNPVPAGSGNGTTTITWYTKGTGAAKVQIYVVGQDGKEVLFAAGSEGSQDAAWISSAAPLGFEFRLYADKKLLDSVVVTRNK